MYLFIRYSRVTCTDIIDNLVYLGNQVQRGQLDAQLYHCIKNSVAAEGRHKILAERDTNHMNGQPSGPLLFKLLMQKVVIDNWATSSFLIQKNVSNQDSHMATVKADIEEFNRYVKLNYQGLQARGESYDGIMVHPIKAYQVFSDQEFLSYIKPKKMEHNEGTTFISPEQPMMLALNKYSLLNKQNM